LVRDRFKVQDFSFKKTEDEEATSSKAGIFVPKGPPNESLMIEPLLLRLSQ
jgi:hypothetical protein